MRRFASDDRGNVAVLFALTLVPLTGLAGAAFDYSRANEFRAFTLKLSDEIALAAAVSDDPEARTTLVEAAKARIAEKYGAGVARVEVAGRWIDNANFQVTIQAGVPLRLMPPLPGVPRDIATSVTAVANRVAPQFKTLPPTLSQLSPEAGDYNRISLYCYDPKRAGAADGGRRAVTPIADNGGTDFSRATLPECQPGEFPSYMNYNVRNARSSPSKWNGRNQEVYEYYADTARDENTGALRTTIAAFKVEDAGKPAERRVSFSVAQTPILETILCNTRDECRPKSERGILPNNHETGRTPATAAGACAKGKFMYYGWEDRPVGDRDFDDIRLVVSCPEEVKISDKMVRLAK
jgi:hypothetical protein